MSINAHAKQLTLQLEPDMTARFRNVREVVAEVAALVGQSAPKKPARR